MGSPGLLDKTYNAIIRQMKGTGQAPHYTELAVELGVSVEVARNTLHELVSLGIPGIWLFPDTDYICSFAPFSNLPTQYRITVDGEQKWFGQWGFESLAVCWLFPGKLVQIDAPCLDCGSTVHVEMRDGVVLKTNPEGIMGYVTVPLAKWMQRLPYAWSTMNLFRSEEHIRNWGRYDSAAEQGILPLESIVKVFSGIFFQRRLDSNYVSHAQQYFGETLSVLSEIAKKLPFWTPPEPQ
jgi:hypothetical protein